MAFKRVTLRTAATGSGLLLAVALFFAVNIISNLAFKSVRFDLTQNKVYTLSHGTRSILASLDEPVTLRLYYSDRLASGFPDVKSYAVRVEELLQQYQRLAKGKIRLSIIDPEPFSDEEDRAVGYGLQGIPIQGGTGNFYFGLVGTSSTDQKQTIAFLQPDRGNFLEYDLTKLIYRLERPKPPVIGLLSTLPLDGGAAAFPAAMGGTPGAGEPWTVYEQMTQLFTVHKLDTGVTAIPKDVDVLMLVHPKGLSQATLYAIDQFVLHGGRALVFADPDAEADRPSGGMSFAAPPTPQHSDLGPLLKAWGVKLTENHVVGDLEDAKKVRYDQDGRLLIRDYPIWMDVPTAQMDDKDIVTADLDKVTLASPGSLTAVKGGTTTVTPLLTTGPQAMEYATAQLAMADPDGLLKLYHPTGRYTLAVRVTGPTATAFPDGPPPPPAKDKDRDKDPAAAAPAPTPAPQIKKSLKPVNLIIVADSDMLEDRFWVHTQNFLGRRLAMPTADNGNFVINALDNLSGSNALISVRSRGSFSRPFIKVRALQQAAEQRFQSKEQALRQRLQETEEKLQGLQSQRKDANGLILTSAQEQEIKQFRQEEVHTRKELRDVQHQLRKDIEGLEGRLKFIDIGLVPLLIAVGGVTVGVYRQRRRQARA